MELSSLGTPSRNPSKVCLAIDCATLATISPTPPRPVVPHATGCAFFGASCPILVFSVPETQRMISQDRIT